MNKQLQDYARNFLKTHVTALPEKNQIVFKLMYGRNGGQRSVEDAKAMDVPAVVDEIPSDKLDWAMHQVSQTIDANNAAIQE